MFTIVAMAVCTSAAALVTVSRFVGFQWIVNHGKWFDIAFTVGIGVLLAGTMTGMLVAIMAGLIMAVFLGLCKLVQSKAQRVKPTMLDDEHTIDGEWIYNTDTYL